MIFIPQKDQMDCGPACLAMISSYYGKDIGIQSFREKCYITREGVSVLGIADAAEHIGFKTLAARSSIADLQDQLLPCILYWNQNHFVVLNKIVKNRLTGKFTYKIIDPGHGFITLSENEFKKYWLIDEIYGIALFLEPTEQFNHLTVPKEEKLSFNYLFKYLKPHKNQMFKMFLLLLFGTLITLIFPILTQKLIDEGVSKKNISIVGYILLAQLAFFLGNIVINIFRNWIMLNVGTKINISIISDFLKKLLKLPIKYFDTKLMGDFNQRIQDHERIEQFLTSQSLITLFSLVTFSVFFVVLWYYDYRIVVIYIILTMLSVTWSLYWLKKRKVLDYFRFQQRSENQESIYEIINGVSEMKLNQFEDFKRNQWEKIQQKLFLTNIRILKLDQIQLSGFEFINQLKNIVVTFLAATYVVQGHMTLGALMSVSYIIGQMNSPISQLINFFRSMQDAKLSLSRLDEVQNHPQEEQEELKAINLIKSHYQQDGITKGIIFKQVAFQYEGPTSPYILRNINLLIPEGKVTAIVGASGSGKTTLMKLLLRFYDPTQGIVNYNGDNLLELSPRNIRENCGVVMQDGFIFSDTIERNIATGDENIDRDKLLNAVKIANIKSFIEDLPLGYMTKIGAAGSGISGGQKQRILIARAVYKNPHYLFFDEATSALDAENEKIIHDNLQSFFKGKTVVIIAHRLSTVKNADQIIVLKNGQIVEHGNHQELVAIKNQYYNLVKNQLELGS
ncbi:peptidase domain-containing ABC transporter [Pedobacter sp. WC2423]|uniref:peptidase domain-containing ABC transporter n=1 Tax=Pedobacter sp. WC2423 TaxID=3234142 RepID=UPI0034663670